MRPGIGSGGAGGKAEPDQAAIIVLERKRRRM
jgi:hypothetical protein